MKGKYFYTKDRKKLVLIKVYLYTYRHKGVPYKWLSLYTQKTLRVQIRIIMILHKVTSIMLA